MPQANFRFGGGPEHTILSPIALVAMLLGILLILILPRKYVIVPLLCCAILVPLGQEVVVAGIHLMVLRILILAGGLRIIMTKLSSREKILSNGFGALDRYFVFYAILAALTQVLLYRQTAAAINSCGFLLDTLGGYFLMRFVIRDKDDIYRTAKTFGWIAGVMALAMLNEQFRHQNVFGFLGSFPVAPWVRDGRIRAQGPFDNPITAGVFGATLLPLFYLLWKTGKSKAVAVAGAIFATVIMVTSASSTPLLAYAGGVLAICLWPLRENMRAIRWGLVIGLISLQLVMKAPIWFVITHFDLVGGSNSYHRAELIQQFATHFGDWWLIGTKNNAFWGWDMIDVANQFVGVGEGGGLAPLLCFIGVIVVGFRWLGKARKSVKTDRKQEWFLWLLGSALFANIVAFFGIDYFDQIRVPWFALLAMIAAAAMPVLAEAAGREAQPAGALSPRRPLLPAAPASRATQRRLPS